MRVCIVVPAMLADEKLYNITLRFLDSIDKRTVYPNYEVLIYDNNSDPRLTEGLVREISSLSHKERFRIKVLKNYKFNLSQVYNMALRDSNADIFVMSNNDMEIMNPEWLTNIVKWFEITPNLGICVPYHDFIGNPVGVKSVDIIKDNGNISFAVYSMSRKVIENIKGFDERFDLYFHDHDVYNTVRAKGYRVLWAYNAIVKHYGERTTIDCSKVERHDYDGAYKLLREKRY